jgi:hypothetical protein
LQTNEEIHKDVYIGTYTTPPPPPGGGYQPMSFVRKKMQTRKIKEENMKVKGGKTKDKKGKNKP